MKKKIQLLILFDSFKFLLQIEKKKNKKKIVIDQFISICLF